VLLSLGFMLGMPQELSDDSRNPNQVRDAHILILDVEKGSPAAAAAIRSGDILQTLDGAIFKTPDEVITYIQEHQTASIAIALKRGSQAVSVNVTPLIYGSHDKPILGISMARAGIVRYSFFEAWYRGAQATLSMTVLILLAFIGLISSLLHGTGVADQISGPVGVAVLTGQVAQLGFPYLINFAAMLSINLGILNIMPFPALDGGRVLFVVLEKIKGKPVNARVENIFHTIGFSLLILLVLVVTYRDIAHYGADILRGLKSLVS
jgi:regulator of sigma E protease